MKRITACILSVLLLFVLFPGLRVSAASGSHGDDLHWEYDDATQTLTVSGTGEMPYDAPSYESEEDKYGWYYLRDSIRHLVIEEGITRVSVCAFTEYPNLRTVSLPASLRSIGDSAFYNCTMLTDIFFQSTPEELGRYIFYGCTSLTSVILPEGLTELPARMFSGCTNLADVHLPDTLKVIGAGAFDSCYDLREIRLPEGLTCIEQDAFCACNRLASVSFPDTLEQIGENAFAYCNALTELQLPEDLESIGEGAFRNCASLTAVTFLGGLTELPAQTFYSCTRLVSVVLPEGLEHIGKSVFTGCTALKTVAFPETLKTIEKYAFKNCTALEPVKLPAMTQVSMYAFEGCPGQGHLFWNILLADSGLYLTLAAVALIGLIWLIRMRRRTGPRIFWSRVGAVALVTAVVAAAGIGLMLRQQRWVDIPDENTYEYDATTKTLTASGTGGLYRLDAWYPPTDGAVEHLVIEEGITEIGHYVFNKFTDLKTVSLPDSLQVIRGCAFAECGQLTDINIPWHTSVSHSAFYKSAWPPAVAVRMFILYAIPFLLCVGLILALVVPSVRDRLERRRERAS